MITGAVNLISVQNFRFCSMTALNEKIGKYEIRYKLFDEIEPIDEINLKALKIDDNNVNYESSGNNSWFMKSNNWI